MRRVGTTLAVCLSLLVAGGVLILGGPNGHAQEQVVKTISVGAWNIEHLGNVKSRGAGNNDHAQKAEDIAEYIQASEVDMLALSEISETQGGKNLTLTRAFDIIKKATGQTWQHVLFPKPDGNKNQLIGVAWNEDKVKSDGEPFKINVPSHVDNVPNFPKGADLWNRHPHAMKFSFGKGLTDVVIIPVHMKANTQGTPPPKVRREFEAKTLMQELANIQTKFKDFDIVICGDTNFLNKNEAAPLLFKAFGFVDQNEEDEKTHVGGAPFDRFFTPKAQPEFAGFDQNVFDEEFIEAKHPDWDSKDFRRHLSDHFMVRTRIRIQADDDQ